MDSEKGIKLRESLGDFLRHPLRMPVRNLLGLNISFVILGIVCLSLSSIITFLIGFSELFIFIFRGNESLHHYLPSFIHVDLPHKFSAMICKVLETNLIGVILFICAVSLYYLFWKDIQIPAWLQIKDVSQLKEKLVGIIITILGVAFLEHALEWSHPKEILMYGGAISLIMLVLVFYTKILISENKHHKE